MSSAPHIQVRFALRLIVRQSYTIPYKKKNTKEDNKLKQITKEEMTLLLDRGILRNSHHGIVDKNGFTVGFYRTRNKRYIEDKYVGIARKLS